MKKAKVSISDAMKFLENMVGELTFGGLIEAMRQNLGPHDFLELAHRLDRETSGCLLFAKRRSVLRLLQQHQQQGQTEKQYCALLRGHWPWGRRTVNLPLEKSTLGSEQVVSHSSQGKSAISHFEFLS